MSYILDALRKSDEKRKKSEPEPARSGLSFSGLGPPTRPRKNTFALILTSCMLVVAIILGSGWWWSQKNPPVTEDHNQAEQLSAEAPDGVPDSPPGEAPEPAESTPPLPPTVQGSQTQEQTQNPTTPRPDLKPPADIPYLSEMRTDFQTALPPLQFSGHVYSAAPELRMIMINNSVVREGDSLTADLTLIEITEQGVILRFDTTPFQIKLF